MKSSSFVAAGVLAASLISSPVLANSTGITGYSGKAGATCTTCHNAPGSAAAPTVTLTGPSTLAAGATGSYSISIKGGAGTVGGTNIAASSTAATLTALTGSGLQKIGSELTHTSPKSFSAGEIHFDFTMTAPSSGGTVTLYGAGNSANGNGATTGDSVGATTLAVTVTGGSGGGTDAGTPTDGGTAVDPEPEKTGGCSSTGGAPVLALVLAAAAMTGLRRRRD